ncbi:MAG: radical SAM family heme chaperone HemW [Gemmatimonadaceae bacterium]|nr:radical SAM family heme chaperone HemW [Gemmatimonadaceae bacterium]
MSDRASHRASEHASDASTVAGRDAALASHSLSGRLQTPDGISYRHVYVHVPFCARRCSYCDFSIAVRRVVPVDDFVAALAHELRARFGAPNDAGATLPALDTLYLGGGTPSRLGGEGVARVIALVTRHAALAPGAEVTVEANPEDVTPAAVASWREAGVNRVSLGVQSFDASVLAWMHRTHDVAAVHAAARTLAEQGITNWSLDLIYALPRELARDWGKDLDQAIALRPAHISAYGLTVEQGTPLSRWRARGGVHDASEERYEADFLLAHQLLAAAGYLHYEVSNWGAPGLESRHNSSYWRGVPYLGLGPAAHGFDGDTRRWNVRDFVPWRTTAMVQRDPIGGSETLTAEQRALEEVYVGLRTLQGVPMLEGDEPLVSRWIAEGWGELREQRLVLTPHGWLRLDAIVAALTEHRSRY